MTLSPPPYADWKAPATDGEHLIWPPPSQLLSDTRSNAAELNSAESCLIQNTPLPALRRNMRQWLGHDPAGPLFATGHQTELHHPGVWVKNAMIDAAAKKLDGVAIHFAVDTDQPKHLSLRWPGASFPLTDDPDQSTAEWSGLLGSPTPAHVDELRQSLAEAQAQWSFEPMANFLLDTLRKLTLSGEGLSATLTHAQHALDWELGLNHHAMLLSPMLQCDAYLAFVHHVLARADQFAADYNTALADYRAQASITNIMRPMPDLARSADHIEIPFWLDNLDTDTRSRAAVFRAGLGFALVAGEDRFVADPTTDGFTAAERLKTWLHKHRLRLSPRALSLTTFLRLIVVDQFVHGIGGGRYDQVTDRLIASHFGIAPPRFAVTTATLFFPDAIGRTRACLPCLLQERHRLRHGILGEKKRKIVDRLTAMPRSSLQRSIAFHNMHAALATAVADSPTLQDWNDRYQQAEQHDRQDQIMFDRELSYSLQSKERLTKMIQQYQSSFA